MKAGREGEEMIWPRKGLFGIVPGLLAAVSSTHLRGERYLQWVPGPD